MKIQLIKNDVIKLDIPSFVCDKNAVGEHLNDHPLTQLLNIYGFLCIVGKPGSGKTSFAISLMTQKKPKIYKKTHHHVIIIMPSDSISSLKKNPFEKLPKENLINELTDESIMQINKRIEGYTKKGEKTLLFIDDMTAKLKSSAYIIEILKTIIFNRRHLKTNVIITVQSFVNIPLDLRKNISNLVLFKPSKKEFQQVFDELLETKKDLALKIMKITYMNDNHNFLFLNVPLQRMFKNFDEFKIKDDSDSDSE
jgi:ABC-type dipeptide/oligopeptide/nickel transport system ATPase component